MLNIFSKCCIKILILSIKSITIFNITKHHMKHGGLFTGKIPFRFCFTFLNLLHKYFYNPVSAKHNQHMIMHF